MNRSLRSARTHYTEDRPWCQDCHSIAYGDSCYQDGHALDYSPAGARLARRYLRSQFRALIARYT